jgi:1A family penicillin-binding protein
MRRRFWSFVIRHWSFIAGGLLALALLSTVTASVVIRRIVVDLPSPDRLYERAAAPSTRIYDRHGRLLYEILDPHGGAHAPLPLAEVPPACIEATVATEDASFYSNPGVDLWAIVRALRINLRGGEILSGGSTITQQLARNLLLLPEERTEISLERKLRESILAWRLARTYTKDEILTLYLNETYYGNLAYGIEAAARTHFAKSAAELDLAECALLAGLPQSPAPYNPLENPQAAKARQSVVLGLMVKHGYISPQEADLAADEKLYFASVLFPIQAPHFVMLVRGQLERDFGLEAIYTRGLEVHTTLDLDAQNAAQRFVRHRLAQLASSQDVDQPSHEVRNAAVVVIDPNTGEVLALVGSPDYFDPRIDGAVNAAVTIRQPGSSIKPITYAAAFDPTLPDPLTAATMMMDVRTAFVTREGEPYVPRNYDRQWRGPVLLREALASSYNLIAVQVLDHVTIERMTALARSMGITTFDDADRWGLALTLGGGEVRLLELTAAYGAFANGGYRLEPVTITRVEDGHGQVLKAWDATLGPRVMDERVAHLITDILSDNFARAPTFGEGSALRLSRPAAAKTGTTSDWRDNWTVGYTPDLVVGVWTGNADNQPMQHVSGVEGAAPIWHDVMETLLKGWPVREFVEPPGMVWVEVCADSGLPPAQGVANERVRAGNREQGSGIGNWGLRRPARCPRTVAELFIDGTEPTRPDDWHWWFTLDMRNGLLAGSNCPPQFTAQERYTLYPAGASEWVRWQGIPQPPETYSPLCPDSPATHAGPQTTEAAAPSFTHSPSSPLVMTSPDQGSHYQVSPEIPPSAQQIVVAVQPIDGVALRQVTLLADGRPLATLTRPPYQALWPMETGTHQFTATGVDVEGNDVQGNRVTIEVTK